MITFVDLFCGGGLGARGAVNAGAVPLLGVDAWDRATETYKANFPDAHVICDRIENIKPLSLAREYNPDVLLTSPECTSHSIARGARPAFEGSRETAIGVIPWLKAMNPRWLIVENVNRMKQWDRHNELIGSIEKHGYTVSDLYLNAADFGASQARKRMFLICDREGTEVTKSDLLSKFGKKELPASSIIDTSGKYKSRPLYHPRRAKATLDRAERAIEALGKGEDFIVVYYGSDYAGGWQRLDTPLRTITTIDRFGLVTWEGETPMLRMLQPSELIKAMSGGEDHSLPHGSRREKVKLCGNGVCSPVMEAIFRHISSAMPQEYRISRAS